MKSDRGLRVLLHDFGGYAFIVESARALARHGCEVVFTYCADVPLGKGDMSTRDGEGALTVVPLEIGREFRRYAAAGRFLDERAVGRRLGRLVREVAPDVVVSANAPLLVQRAALAASRRTGAGFVYWLQDLLGVGIRGQLGRLGIPGRVAGERFAALERRLLARSDHVIAIGDAFAEALRAMGITVPVTVVENWAPLAETPVRPRDNTWARSHALTETTNFVYSGTLGLKHDPAHLVHLAEALSRASDRARVVVISQGRGADHVRAEAGARALANLTVLPYQPYEDLPDLLATADVLLALLEPAAGAFSIPSKILTYHAAARPILAAMPAENRASRLVRDNRSGIVTAPGDHAAFAAAGLHLLDDPDERERMGASGRRYAEAAFDVDAKVAVLLPILERAARR